jgi:hypothetical protein
MRVKKELCDEIHEPDKRVRRIFATSAYLGNVTGLFESVTENICQQIEEATDLGELLRVPGLGHRLNLHATKCSSCRSKVRPYWNAALNQLPPEQLDSIRMLDQTMKSRIDKDVLQVRRSYDSIKAARKLVVTARRELGASSCIVYLRDPTWTQEFRVLSCPGVKLPEPMQGFVGPVPVVTGGASESFCLDARLDSQRRNSSCEIPESIPATIRPLFGDFVEREGVVSSARLAYPKNRTPKVIIFVNFNRRITFSEDIKRRTRRLLGELLCYRAKISAELQAEDAPTVRQMLNIMKAADVLAVAGLDHEDELKRYFDSVLDAAMEATGVRTQTGVGTIHLYDSETHVLSLAAYRGMAEHIDWARAQSVNEGMGVISWAALRKRPLIISDLEKSMFRRIHVPIQDGTKSAVIRQNSGRL